MSLDTGRARLPGLPAVNTGNASLDRWIQAVSERLEVREGTRGSPYERVVTLRDLKALGMDSTQWEAAGSAASVDSASGVLVQQASGSYARVPMEAFFDGIRDTRLYHDLLQRVDDATRFDGVPEQVRALLLQDIAEEAAARGAAIRHVEQQVQSASESLAYAVQEVTASVAGAAAGVRETAYASATANRATAGKITQVTARLDAFSGGAAGTATVEQKMTAIADRSTGLEAQYTLKAQAGNKFAGIGLAATSPTAGAGTSAIIFSADKFAIVGPNEVIADPANPPVNRLPFGYDSGTNTIYMSGNLLVGGTISSTSINTSAFVQAAGASGAVSTALGASTTAAGVFNLSAVTPIGVIGKTSAAVGAGVYGESTTGSDSGFGLFGYGYYGALGRSHTAGGVGVIGQGLAAGGHGVRGDSGTSANSIGVLATTSGSGTALGVEQATQTGTGAATFDGINKPGGASSNVWLRIKILGFDYYVPVWA